jgi:plasmid maintenance system antidote protein VapI
MAEPADMTIPAAVPAGRPGRDLLGAYIRERDLSLSGFAAQVETHSAHLGRLLSGERSPGLELALAIEKATGGVVPAESWIEKRPGHARKVARTRQ